MILGIEQKNWNDFISHPADLFQGCVNGAMNRDQRNPHSGSDHERLAVQQGMRWIRLRDKAPYRYQISLNRLASLT